MTIFVFRGAYFSPPESHNAERKKKMNEIDSKEVSNRLLYVIKESKLSYYTLEKITGISKSSINRYANGKAQKIPLEVIEKVALATNSSMQWIMGIEDNGKDKKIGQIETQLYRMNDNELDMVMIFIDSIKAYKKRSGFVKKSVYLIFYDRF